MGELHPPRAWNAPGGGVEKKKSNMKYAQLACSALLLMGLLSGCGDDSETSTMPVEPSMPTADSQSDPAMSGTGADGVENASARDDGNVTDGEMDGEATQDIAEILETDPRFSRVLELVNLIGLLDVMRTRARSRSLFPQTRRSTVFQVT